MLRHAIVHRALLGALIGGGSILGCGTEAPKDKPRGDTDGGHAGVQADAATNPQTQTHETGRDTMGGSMANTANNTFDTAVTSEQPSFDGGALSQPVNDAGTADAASSPTDPSQTSDASAPTDDTDTSASGAADAGAAVEVELLVSSVVEKVDMLFVIDNSMSMADKQAFMQEAVPDLMQRFVNPVCLDVNGDEVPRPDGATTCPSGSAHEFSPIKDINIGLITSSLGAFGSDTDCLPDARGGTYNQTTDMARLVGSLERGADMGGDFLQWRSPSSDLDTLMADFRAQVVAVSEFGCGWEATMESWVRFLVDPYPYQEIVRAPCSAGDVSNSCGKPKTDSSDVPLIDQVVLDQRNRFLRPDSLLAVIMLTDENDCSFKVGGQQILLSDSQSADGQQSQMFRASAACATDPNDPCCHSCGVRTPDGCDGSGCEELVYERPSGAQGEFSEDQINLRCFKQKQRFGLDFLYPVERYANALSLAQICPTAPDLHPDNCNAEAVVDNPVFTATVNGQVVTRPQSLVFFAGILGVPWQDVAHDPTGQQPLKYKKAADSSGASPIDWDLLLGSRSSEPKPAGVLKRELYPSLASGIDPLMYESVLPRLGTNPATDQALGSPTAGYMANAINGHEWNPLEGSDLQYACIFKLKQPVICPTPEERAAAEANEEGRQPNCDCTSYANIADLEYNTPLCQSEDGYSITQTHAKAYPGIRELQALELFSELNPQKNAIVASICPKESEDDSLPDFGYRPAVATIVDRLKEQLQDQCLPQPLALNNSGHPACVLVEVATEASGCEGDFREPVDETIARDARRMLEAEAHCSEDECDDLYLCQISQVMLYDADYNACISGTGGDGWCYADEAQYEGIDVPPEVARVLESCPNTAKRKLSLVGGGRLTAPSSRALYVCSDSM